MVDLHGHFTLFEDLGLGFSGAQDALLCQFHDQVGFIQFFHIPRVLRELLGDFWMYAQQANGLPKAEMAQRTNALLCAHVQQE